MITTNKINVKLSKGRRKLTQISTKDVDASIKVKLPKISVKPMSVSTHALADVSDIAKVKVDKADGKELKKLNMRFAFVDFFCEDTIQCFPRRELK